MTPLRDSKQITVKFASSLSDQMKWKFAPGNSLYVLIIRSFSIKSSSWRDGTYIFQGRSIYNKSIGF